MIGIIIVVLGVPIVGGLCWWAYNNPLQSNGQSASKTTITAKISRGTALTSDDQPAPQTTITTKISREEEVAAIYNAIADTWFASIAKAYAQGIFVLQTAIICLAILIVLVEADWQAIKQYFEIVGTDYSAHDSSNNIERNYSESGASGFLRALMGFASWLVLLFQYLFFGAYGFGWGEKKD